MTFILTFSPKTVSKELLAELSDRSRKVLTDRFGLSSKGNERTLDSIGKEYGITRERVRQIENHGILSVRESEVYTQYDEVFEALKAAIEALGGAAAEHTVLSHLSKNDIDRRHLVFLLSVGHHFKYRRENNDFHGRWYLDEQLADQIENALSQAHSTLASQALVSEDELVQMLARFLKEEGVTMQDAETLMRWLSMSTRLARNPLGDWGRADSAQVAVRNTRDFAYLTWKRHGSTMHFTEVASNIEKRCGRKTHAATTQNERIKDGRLVLVGRGLYALKEGGYAPGVVREVIKGVLDRDGALSREEIIERVKRERYVKDATITVNLQHSMFTRLADGRYALSK